MWVGADKIEIIYEGKIIFDSGFVTDSHTASKYIDGFSTIVYLTMTPEAPYQGTK